LILSAWQRIKLNRKNATIIAKQRKNIGRNNVTEIERNIGRNRTLSGKKKEDYCAMQKKI